MLNCDQAWIKSPLRLALLGVVSNFEPRRKGHPALEVCHLAAWRGRLEASHVPITEDEPLLGWSRFYITDPWDNRIELLERCEE